VCFVLGCDKKFTSKFKLKRHILIHSQTKTFSCDICRRSFRRKDHLKNHEKVHDPGKTVYTCAYAGCARAYNSLSSFKKHQAMHSAEEGQLDCKICRAVLLSQVRGTRF
jgi:zinc finger protein PLAG1